jgi:hypothetical protein
MGEFWSPGGTFIDASMIEVEFGFVADGDGANRALDDPPAAPGTTSTADARLCGENYLYTLGEWFV